MTAKPDEVPGEWITTLGLMELRRINRSKAERIMRAMHQSGRAERKTFRIVRGGRLLPVFHYRIVK